MQAKNSTKEQFDESSDLHDTMTEAIIGAFESARR